MHDDFGIQRFRVSRFTEKKYLMQAISDCGKIKHVKASGIQGFPMKSGSEEWLFFHNVIFQGRQS
jgi:hypothetical protein